MCAGIHRATPRRKKREDLTCVSTDFYPYLVQNRIKEAKSLLHHDEGCQIGSRNEWKTPDSRIATAKSRILLIPCHAIMITGEHHWFLTIRIKVTGGKHEILIIDSLGKDSGEEYRKKTRPRLIKMKLITKKDKSTVLKTKIQTENECGVRIVAYMIMMRNMDLQNRRSAEIIAKIKSYVARERGFTGDLAAHRRLTIHRLIKNEQARIKV